MSGAIHLYTIHAREGRSDLVVVADRKQPLGVLPPVWAIWRGLWLTLAAQAALFLAVALLLPQAASPVWIGLVALTVLEGSSIERLEWRLRGWREVAMVEARSDEGAEEAYVTGEAIAP